MKAATNHINTITNIKIQFNAATLQTHQEISKVSTANRHTNTGSHHAHTPTHHRITNDSSTLTFDSSAIAVFCCRCYFRRSVSEMAHDTTCSLSVNQHTSTQQHVGTFQQTRECNCAY
jgi:hypothetical protein